MNWMKKIWGTISIFLVLFAGWIVFSRNGYLPKVLTCPFVKQSGSHYSIYINTGTGFGNKIVNYYQDGYYGAVEKGGIRKLGILNNKNLTYSRGYYDKNEDAFYLNKRGSIRKYIQKKKKHEEVATVKGSESIVLLDGLYLCFTEDYVYVGGGHELDIKKYSIQDYGYEYTTNILYRNESGSISLQDFIKVCHAVKSGSLLGWYPESNTAVYKKYVDNQLYFYTFTIGDDNEKSYGPYDISDSYFYGYKEDKVFYFNKAEQKTYFLNFRNGEEKFFGDTPNLSVLRYYVDDDHNITLAGITEYSTAWLYSSRYNQVSENKVETTDYNRLIVGNDCLYFFSLDNQDKDSSNYFYNKFVKE